MFFYIFKLKKAAAQIPNPESVNDFPTMDAPAKKGGKKKSKFVKKIVSLQKKMSQSR